MNVPYSLDACANLGQVLGWNPTVVGTNLRVSSSLFGHLLKSFSSQKSHQPGILPCLSVGLTQAWAYSGAHGLLGPD